MRFLTLLSIILIQRLTYASTATKAYQIQQQLYLQSRSLQLRQALIDRGLDALKHSQTDENLAKPIDWDCALSTEQSPKSCLYSFDAPPNAKVIAPIDTTQYITLQALNRLRRTDPTKIEPLWHSQYQILNSWFSSSHKYSVYTHLTPLGTVLALLLDSPLFLSTALFATITLSFLLTLPLWETLIKIVLTNQFLWLQWPQWGRFLHAALPLKLLLGQMAWRGVTGGIFDQMIFQRIRAKLIDMECQILEDCIPLTIVEQDDALLDEEDPDNEGMADYEDEESDYE